MELTEHRFDELSHLQYRVFTCGLGGVHHATAMVLKFSGSYGIGSEGNGDAEFMRVMTLAALSAWRVHAVVFDLTEVDYEWGDAIRYVFGRGTQPSAVGDMPAALVISGRCRKGFSSFASFIPKMFDDLESALAFVAPPARENLDRLLAKYFGGA